MPINGDTNHAERIIVKIDENLRDDMTNVVAALQRKGFILEQTLEPIGILVGLCSRQVLEELRRVPGVIIAQDKEISLVN